MKVLYKKSEVLLPDFLFVGASRCGTTSLYLYLKQHPEIFMPSLKEPQFFSYLGENFSPHDDSIRSKPWNVEDYLQIFHSARPEQVVGEASTSYLYIFPKTQSNIKAIYGDKTDKLKIIGVLRNPIDRAWSMYMLKKQGGGWKEDLCTIASEFEDTGDTYEYWDFLKSGRYYEQVKAYQEMFSATKFFLFEELVSEPDRVVKEIFEFVGVRDIAIPSNVGKTYNFSGVPRNMFFVPLYKMLFDRNRFKKFVKQFIPEAIRFKIKTVVGARIVKKARMPEEVKTYLLKRFEEDLKKLPDLFPNERQKRIIKGWLK